MKYTIAELNAIRHLCELPGPTRTGITNGVRYKRVDLAPSETFAEAIVASYRGKSPVVITEPAKRDQFLHRGC